MIKGHEGWLGEWFSSLQPWTPDVMVVARRVWIRCYGIPLHMWNGKCFQKVVASVGDLVK